MTIWNARTGESMDEEAVELAKTIWSKATKAARERMAQREAAKSQAPTPPGVSNGALNPKGNYGLMNR